MANPQQDNFIEGNWDSISGIHRFCHEAMAAVFEVIILHEDSRYAQQAARAAFDELERLEAELSRFIENSDISRINNLAANQPLRVGLDAFECLQLSARAYAETNGAFDITFGSQYPKLDARIEYPTRQGKACRSPIKLDKSQYTVELLTSPVRIDLGGIGKGFAVDRMAELLREWSIDAALISGGYSSVLALDAPPETKGWPVTLSNPPRRFASQTRSSGGKQTLACLYLQGRSVSASGLQKGLHIIDPRTARPVEGKIAAWSCASDAATADALSTAFMVMSPDEIKQYCLRHPDVQAMVIMQGKKKELQKGQILQFGSWE